MLPSKIDDIINPVYSGSIDSQEYKISDSLMEIVNWALSKGSKNLTIRRFNRNISIQIKPIHAYVLDKKQYRRIL